MFGTVVERYYNSIITQKIRRFKSVASVQKSATSLAAVFGVDLFWIKKAHVIRIS